MVARSPAVNKYSDQDRATCHCPSILPAQTATATASISWPHCQVQEPFWFKESPSGMNPTGHTHFQQRFSTKVTKPVSERAQLGCSSWSSEGTDVCFGEQSGGDVGWDFWRCTRGTEGWLRGYKMWQKWVNLCVMFYTKAPPTGKALLSFPY